ncbi:type IV secretion system protein [Marinicella sp. W31]|uniref:type IV secretion system protein n=1 Tax=Marinicella sp. W31 TaxID=3023713 RepID=UPI0037583943
MNKLVFALLLGISQLTMANPRDVAMNVFNEYRQVIELIEQLNEMRNQIEELRETIRNISGRTIFEISDIEERIREWLPEGNEIYDPIPTTVPGTYGYNFNKWKEALDFPDPAEIYDIDPDAPPVFNKRAPDYQARKRHQEATIAATAYAETLIEQTPDRMEVINDYLQKMASAHTLKVSVDINAQILAQANRNQIEINRTLSMLLSLKSAEAQRKLTLERYYHKLLTGDRR